MNSISFEGSLAFRFNELYTAFKAARLLEGKVVNRHYFLSGLLDLFEAGEYHPVEEEAVR